MRQARKISFWVLLALVVILPIALAAMSPQLEWRRWPYIASGFAGIIAMALLLFQPLLAGNLLPAVSAPVSRKVHRLVGTLIVVAIVVHVAGLWITSPPDVIDVFLFRSPTPFSIWGMAAMLALIATALIAMFRKPLQISPRRWRTIHLTLAAVIVVGGTIHALLIEGTMEFYSKVVLCGLLVLVSARLIWLKLRT